MAEYITDDIEFFSDEYHIEYSNKKILVEKTLV